MPIRIPSTLYSGGRAVINTTPFVDAIAKDIATKQAAKAAVVKHADELYKGLNPAGVRAQDMTNPEDPTKGINADINSWYNEAKAGNLDFGKYKELLYNIERSKQIGKEQLEIGQLTQQGKLEPNKDDVLMLNAKDASIYSPSHKDHKIGELSPFVPDLDENKFYTAVIGAAKPQENVGKKSFDAATQRYFIPKEFTTEEEKHFGDVAGSLVAVDKSVKKQFTKQIANPAFLKDAVPAYISVYGVDSIPSYKNNGSLDDFTPDKAAAAAAILRARQMKDVVSYDKPKSDNWKQKLDYAYSLKQKGGAPAIDEYINNLRESGQTMTMNGKQFKGAVIGGKMYEGKSIGMQPDLIDRITVDKGFGTEKVPDDLILTDDNKFVVPIYYKKTPEGKPIPTPSGNSFEIDKTIYSKPMTMPIFRQIVGKLIGESAGGNLKATDIAEMGGSTGNVEINRSGSKQSKQTKKAKYD